MSNPVVRIASGVVVLLVLGVIAVFVLGFAFVVPETHSAVVTRFGDVRRVIVSGFYQAPGSPTDQAEELVIEEDQLDFMREHYEDDDSVQLSIGANLYWKIPFVDRVHFFDSRLLDWDGERKEVATKDLRTLIVDSAGRWRILDPVRFYEAVGPSEIHAQDRLDQVILREIEDMITLSLLIETVRNQNLELEERVAARLEIIEDEELGDVEATQIRYGRMHILEEIQKKAGEVLLDSFGIQLVDIMITELNYTETVQKRVFERMIAERQRIASRHRAEGEQTKQEILGRVERLRREILGNAAAREIEIVAGAHSQDTDFYRFFRSLEAYDRLFDSNSVFLLSDDSPLLEFMTGSQ